MKYPNFIGPSAPSLSLLANAEQTVNFYLEPLPRAGVNSAALYPSPGFSPFATLTDVGSRALYELNGRAFAVVGSHFQEVLGNGTVTVWGTVAQDSFPAQIVGNNNGQLLIASGGNGYSFNLSNNAFAQIATLAGACFQIGMLDDFGIALNAATSTFRLSAFNDVTSWDPTQFALRQDQPDSWTAIIVNVPDLWLIGQKTGIVWYDAGTAPFPFAPRPGASFKYGIIAPWSLAAAGGQIIWLARNAEGAGVVVMAIGYSPTRVSTYEVEAAISGYARTHGIADAEAIMLQYQGHNFYVLTFPAANATWVLDVNTGVWVNWGKWNAPMTRYDYWTPRVHAYAFGQHLTGDRTTNQLSAMDVSFGLEADGSVIRRMRVAPAIFNENRQIKIDRLEVLLENGLGNISDPGSNPVITWSMSEDFGRTYLPEIPATAGKTGDFRKSIYWTRLGISRGRVNKFVMSDPVPWRVIDCFLNNRDPQGAAR